MNMRMVEHRPRPGMQNGHNADLRPQIAFIGRQLHQGGRCGFKQYPIGHLLIAANQPTVLGGYGEHQVEIGDGQHLRQAFLHPLFGGLLAALGAVAVAAAMVAVAIVLTVAALVDVPAQRRRAALADVDDRAPMAGQDSALVAVQIRAAMLSENVGNPSHGC